MYTGTIFIRNIDAAREFVDKMAKFMDTDITLKSGDYSIDGHSIIGIISLDFTKPIEVVIDSDAPESLIEILNEYAI